MSVLEVFIGTVLLCVLFQMREMVKAIKKIQVDCPHQKKCVHPQETKAEIIKKEEPIDEFLKQT